MKKDQAADIIRYYFKRLSKNAERLQKDVDEETIHLFRVDVKKLRAFLRMLRTGIVNPDDLKFPKKFKRMYSHIGKIRDKQLIIKRIRKHDSVDDKVPGKIASLRKETKELASKKDNLLNGKDISEIKERMIKNLPATALDKLSKDFISQKINAIKEINDKGKYTDTELHSIRKNLKDIIYITDLFKDDIKSPLTFSIRNKEGLEKAKRLSDLLGSFNDTGTALFFLNPAVIKKDTTKERDRLATIRRKWLREKRKQKHEVLNGVRTLKWNADNDYSTV